MIQIETEMKQTILDLLDKVAKEQNYVGYTVSISRVSGDGNIMSALFNVTLNAPKKPDLKLIVKMSNMKEKLRKELQFSPYEVELCFYSKLQKSFEKLEKKSCLPVNQRIRMPKLYGFCSDYLKETLVLENLAAQGFQIFDREKSLDMECMYAAIDLMAKFHALSMAYHSDDPEAFRKSSDFLAMNEELEEFYLSIKAKILKNALAAVEGEHKMRLLKFLQKPKNFRQIMDHYRCHGRNILVHGDFKPSNLMHRRRNGKLELAILDFQMVHDGDPVVELMYFIFTATDEQFRRDHYHELLDLYYERLRAALHNLRLEPEKVYPENVYRAQLENCAMLGVVFGAIVLPVILVEDDKAPGFDKEDSRLSDFVPEGSALFKERFNGVINNFVEWGML